MLVYFLKLFCSARYHLEPVTRSRTVYRLVSSCCSGYRQRGRRLNCERMFVNISNVSHKQSYVSTLQQFAMTAILLAHVQPLECVCVQMVLLILNVYVRQSSEVFLMKKSHSKTLLINLLCPCLAIIPITLNIAKNNYNYNK